MSTVKELEARLTEIQQQIAGIVLSFDTFRAEVKADILGLKQAAREYIAPQPTAQPQYQRPLPQEWRMKSARDFKNWALTQKPSRGEFGNVQVSDRLKIALGRETGWAEGQLYINWCLRVKKSYVERFWRSRGYHAIPEGLWIEHEGDDPDEYYEVE